MSKPVKKKSAAQITVACANAANACFKYYCGKELTSEALSRIMHIIKAESPAQSKSHFDYSKQYKAYVDSQN